MVRATKKQRTGNTPPWFPQAMLRDSARVVDPDTSTDEAMVKQDRVRCVQFAVGPRHTTGSKGLSISLSLSLTSFSSWMEKAKL